LFAGKAAGMTVPHFHLHIMPRREGDFKRNDQVYEEIEKESRPKRSEEDMATESAVLGALFPDQLKE
jgi:bis(5'-adenosyl)-triphosphatase